MIKKKKRGLGNLDSSYIKLNLSPLFSDTCRPENINPIMTK
jgi:hypothetical protein